MKRKLLRGTWLLFLTLSLPALSGCSLWGASQAAANVLPLITSSEDSNQEQIREKRAQNPYAGMVADQGGAWQRDVLLDNGQPFDPSQYQEGQPIQIRWTVPVEVGSNVQAIAGLGKSQCLNSQQGRPDRWLLSYGRDGKEAGEAWYVSYSNPTGRNVSQHALTVGAIRTETIGSQLNVPNDSHISWLLVAPQSGFYRLTALWRGQPQEVLEARPCIEHWAQVPMQLAMQATGRTRPKQAQQNQFGNEPTTWSRGSRQQNNTNSPPPPEANSDTNTAPDQDTTAGDPSPRSSASDLETGVSLRPPNRQTTNDSARQSRTNRMDKKGAVDSQTSRQGGGSWREQQRATPAPSQPQQSGQPMLQQAKNRLNLLGSPEYDIIRLHQAALSFEVNPQTSGYEPAYRQALRQLRQQRLQALKNQDDLRGICHMADRPGLNDRALKLWNGESTIPDRLLGDCP